MHRPAPTGRQKVIGHDQPQQLLAATLRADRLGHAYLFSGPEGIGKRLVATQWAMRVNCERAGEQPAGEHGGCGSCPSCAQSMAGTHPDLISIEPDGQFLKIEQIRALQTALSYTPWSGRRKIAIIDRAERLNQEAANSLLKTLEEPPAASLLVLVSAAPDELLPTIRSRCHPVRFLPMEREQLARWLVAEHGWTQADAALAATLSNGSIGQSLANDPAHLRRERDEVDQWVRQSCFGDGVPPASVAAIAEGAEAWGQTPERFEQCLRWLLLWLEDVAYADAFGSAAPHPLRFPCAADAARRLPMAAVCDGSAQLHWMWRASFRNINRPLMLEQWMIRLRDAADASSTERSRRTR